MLQKGGPRKRQSKAKEGRKKTNEKGLFTLHLCDPAFFDLGYIYKYCVSKYRDSHHNNSIFRYGSIGCLYRDSSVVPLVHIVIHGRVHKKTYKPTPLYSMYMHVYSTTRTRGPSLSIVDREI